MSVLKISQWQELKNLKRLWPFIKQERLVFFVTACLVPIISIIQLIQPIILKHAVDEGVMKSDFSQLTFWAGLFFTFVVCEYMSRCGQSIATTVGVERMIRKMRIKLTNHLLHQSLQFHHHNLSGVLVTRSTSEFDSLSESLNEGVLQSAVGIVAILGCVVGMISLHPLLGILSSLMLPVAVGSISYFSQKIKESLLEARIHLAQLNGYTQECLQGMATVKVLVAESYVSKKFKVLSENFRKAQMSSVTFDSILFSLLDGISSVTIGLMLWVILGRLGYDSTLSAGIIVAFVRYLQQMFDPLKQLGNTIALLQGVFTSTDRIFKLLDQNEVIHGDKVLKTLTGRISYRNVNFSYHANGKNGTGFSLKDINLDFHPGQSTALVGPTGGGKSTIIKLLTKQYEGLSGELSIDGHDIRELEPFALRRMIAIVPQDLVLFSGTLAFNIGLGHPSVGLDAIKKAASMVGLDKFIQSLPGAYDFEIDEEGSNLSLGQKQLVVFARALARDPQLVILDEATSALDPVSEKLVQKALENIFKEKTVIVIAHRLSTIRHCDKIIVIQNGRVLEEGQHEELLRNKSLYYTLTLALA